MKRPLFNFFAAPKKELPTPQIEKDPSSSKAIFEIEKFEQRLPSPQNAVDIFAGRWATDCDRIAPGTRSGTQPMFTVDPRPRQADALFGGIQGKRILELGPLEGAHSWQLEHLGAAEIVAIEANAEAYLKCLIVKEISKMQRTHFLYGDFLKYLKIDDSQFDLIFCSGVLYHMKDPVDVIKTLSKHTNKVFVWTHYFIPNADENPIKTSFDVVPSTVTHDNQEYTYYAWGYPDRLTGGFYGGNEAICSWMELDGIISAFKNYGFDHVEIIDTDETHPGGPCVTFGAWKS